MTIKTVNECLKKIKTVVPFKDEETEISLLSPTYYDSNVVKISTEINNVGITASYTVEKEGKTENDN